MAGQQTSVLCVDGKPLTIGPRFEPRLTVRKIYNATYFRNRNERYQHEIANHYRDYKLHPQFERRRARLRRRHYHRQQIFVRPQRRPTTATYGSFDFAFTDDDAMLFDPTACGYRYELPIHTQYFPSFAATYTPRGRRTLCEGEPPDEIYNNTVRRIRAAHSFEQLKALVERQFPTHNKNKKSSKSSSSKQGKIQPQPQQQQQKQQQKEGWHYKSCRTQTPRRVDLHTFLQLANDNYEQGWLANIKYLQSISERNAERRLLQQQIQWHWQQQKQQQQQQQQTSDIEQDHDHNNSDNTSAESSTSNEWYTFAIKNQNCDEKFIGHNKLAKLLQKIGRKPHNVQQQHQHQQKQQQQQHQKRYINNNIVDDDDQQSDWPIRVDITPALGTFNDNTGAVTVATSTTSMSNYVYVNGQQNKPQFEAINSSSINNNNNSNALQQQQSTFYDIIDNLKQLELNDEDIELSSLPKITLTDCSQQQQQQKEQQDELPQATEKTCDNRSNKSQVTQHRITGFILRQTKFGINQSLDIPNETNYHSEARPP